MYVVCGRCGFAGSPGVFRSRPRVVRSRGRSRGGGRGGRRRRRASAFARTNAGIQCGRGWTQHSHLARGRRHNFLAHGFRLCFGDDWRRRCRHSTAVLRLPELGWAARTAGASRRTTWEGGCGAAIVSSTGGGSGSTDSTIGARNFRRLFNGRFLDHRARRLLDDSNRAFDGCVFLGKVLVANFSASSFEIEFEGTLTSTPSRRTSSIRRLVSIFRSLAKS